MGDKQKAFIYGLTDPRDASIRYVGHTANTMVHRLSQHIDDSANTPKTQWIAELAALGLQPGIVQLDAVDYDARYQEEYRWIYLGRQRGWALTNTSAMKTEKYDSMATDNISKVFVALDNGWTAKKIRQAIFSLKDLPTDERERISVNATAFVSFACLGIAIMAWRDWTMQVDLLSALAIAAAAFSMLMTVSAVILVFSDENGRYRQVIAKRATENALIDDRAKSTEQSLFDAKLKQVLNGALERRGISTERTNDQ